MCQKVLIISRHPLWEDQIVGLKKIHGKKVIIERQSVRFRKKIRLESGALQVVDDPEMLIQFHLKKTDPETTNGYDYIYYVLSEKLETQLLKDNLPFGVIQRPKKEAGALTFRILHKISIDKTEIKFEKRLERKGNLGYCNHPSRRYGKHALKKHAA